MDAMDAMQGLAWGTYVWYSLAVSCMQSVLRFHANPGYFFQSDVTCDCLQSMHAVRGIVSLQLCSTKPL